VPLSGKEQVVSYMTVRTKLSIITLLLVFTIAYPQTSVSASGSILTFSELHSPTSDIDSANDETGESDVPLELSIEGFKTLPIMQQPRGNNNFVSSLQDYLTEFQIATNFGTVGLLAHNYLAGKYFFQILPGQEITLVYSGLRTERFVVTEIQRYQALVPESPSSDFIDLTTGKYLTVSQLFRKIYRNQPGYLVLQTCISTQQSSSWGRLFIIAEPAE
jgi:hypothetical protein